MALLDALMQRPLENLPIGVLLVLGAFKLGGMIVQFFSTSNENSTKIQQGSQQIISQDNAMQSKMLDEMTARRISDEEFKRRFLDLHEETVKRIDVTTSATHGTAQEIRAEIVKLKRGVTFIYQKLEREGMLK